MVILRADMKMKVIGKGTSLAVPITIEDPAGWRSDLNLLAFTTVLVKYSSANINKTGGIFNVQYRKSKGERSRQ